MRAVSSIICVSSEWGLDKEPRLNLSSFEVSIL